MTRVPNTLYCFKRLQNELPVNPSKSSARLIRAKIKFKIETFMKEEATASFSF